MDLNDFRKKLKSGGYKGKNGAMKAAGKVDGGEKAVKSAKLSVAKKYGK